MMFNHLAHKEMWGWLAANPQAEKEHWPGWSINGGEYDIEEYICECFACAVVDETDGCSKCPLDWSPYKECTDPHSQYMEWMSTKCHQTRAFLAKVIQELPLKDGYNG